MLRSKRIVLFLISLVCLSWLVGCKEIDETAGETTVPSSEKTVVEVESQPSEESAEEFVGDVREILLAVLANERVFTDESGAEVYLKDYQIGKEFFADVILADPSEYAFVDFDGDGEMELVINVSQNVGFLLVLHYDGKTLRGYESGVRALQSIKEDGSFSQSNGAGSVRYVKLSFENNQKNITTTAVYEYDDNYFEIDGKECTLEELKAYSEMWDAKTDVKWEKVAK